jgi:predicted transcriptional regulator
MLAAAQIRAGRALLDWTGAKLAEASGLSLQTIRRMEGTVGPGRSSVENVDAVRRALEEAGVVFLPGDDQTGDGPGVRLRSSHSNQKLG